MSNVNQMHRQTALMFHLQRLSTQFVSKCENQARLVRQARTMRDVSHAERAVTAKSEIRMLPEVRTAKLRLHTTATERMRELLKPQIESLRQCQSLDEFKVLHARFVRQEWEFLRGDYPAVASEATRTALAVRGLLERNVLKNHEASECGDGATIARIKPR